MEKLYAVVYMDQAHELTSAEFKSEALARKYARGLMANGCMFLFFHKS